MVHLTSVQGPFHARVVVARLGAEGILTELRPPVDGPYPVYRPVDVYVSEDEAPAARELLLADEVEDALSGVGYDEAWPSTLDEGIEQDSEARDWALGRAHRARHTWILVAAVVVLAAMSFAHVLT
jgi:hypothetical protein